MDNKIEIIYEDAFFIAVNKPNNTLVHSSYYARNIKEPDLVELIKEQQSHTFFPIHRLDRKTSGIILLAKEKAFVKDFQQLFEKNEIHKAYFAVVRGFCNAKGIIDTPTKNADTGKYKEALTEYETLKTIELETPVIPYPTSRYSLIKFKPKTGRMHQLRIHANKISHPIIGDHKYGNRHHNKMFVKEFGWENLFLHASSLCFEHPKSNDMLQLGANLPSDWNDLLKVFKWKNIL